MEDKKPRSDSKLDGLSESQRAELVRLLADGESYRGAMEWLDAECMIKTSLAALSAFYKRHVVPLLKERREFAAAQAEAIISQADAVDWDVASKELLKRMTFRELNREGSDVEVVEKLTKLILKNRQVEVNERRLKLLEQQAKAAKDKLEALATENKGGLTPETLRIIEEAAGLL